jgi:hypothetical protein
MSTGIRDARLRELMFLATLNREGPIRSDPVNSEPFDREMVVYLLTEGYLNGAGTLNPSEEEWQSLDRRLTDGRQYDTHCVLNGTPLALAINHKGRVRLGQGLRPAGGACPGSIELAGTVAFARRRGLVDQETSASL